MTEDERISLKDYFQEIITEQNSKFDLAFRHVEDKAILRAETAVNSALEIKTRQFLDRETFQQFVSREERQEDLRTSSINNELSHIRTVQKDAESKIVTAREHVDEQLRAIEACMVPRIEHGSNLKTFEERFLRMEGLLQNIENNKYTRDEHVAFTKAVDEHFRRIEERQSPNYIIYISSFAVLLTVIGALYWLSVDPIKQQLKQLNDLHYANAALIDKLENIVNPIKTQQDINTDRLERIEKEMPKGLTADTFAAWKTERDDRVVELRKRIEEMEFKVDHLRLGSEKLRNHGK